jgi:hypothetical protein
MTATISMRLHTRLQKRVDPNNAFLMPADTEGIFGEIRVGLNRLVFSARLHCRLSGPATAVRAHHISAKNNALNKVSVAVKPAKKDLADLSLPS